MRTEITVDLDTVVNFIIENLDDNEMLHLIKEYDEVAANWDFVHKGYLLFKKIVQDNKREYKEYLEDMVQEQEHSIVEIMDGLEDK